MKKSKSKSRFWFARFNQLSVPLMAEADDGSNGGDGGGAAGGSGESKPNEKPDGEGAGDTGGDDKGAGDGDKGGDDKGGEGKPSESEAKLLKEVMTRKQAQKDLENKLKAFGEVTPEQVKALLDAEATRKAAEADAQKSDLEKRGEFDRLKQVMLDEHEKTVGTKDTRIGELETTNQSLIKQIEDMTVGASFASSKFIGEEMLLTPSKARVVYGTHFDVKDGKVVGYDKPAGAPERTTLVNGRGEPLSFEDAMKKLVEIDPERDSLLRSKSKPGSGSNQPAGGPKDEKVSKGIGRISAGLASEL